MELLNNMDQEIRRIFSVKSYLTLEEEITKLNAV